MLTRILCYRVATVQAIKIIHRIQNSLCTTNPEIHQKATVTSTPTFNYKVYLRFEFLNDNMHSSSLKVLHSLVEIMNKITTLETGTHLCVL